MALTRNIQIMGILNVTPDSFYDGGRYSTQQERLEHTEKMLFDGADVIDIGGMSTRPGCVAVSEEEEYQRVIPTVKLLLKHFPKITISLDTFRTNIARAGCDEGCKIINDISGGCDEMYKVVSEYHSRYILTHFIGKNGKMDINYEYNDILKEMFDYFEKKIETLKLMNINDIIVDPGFGFSKSVDDNYVVLDNLIKFKKYEYPLLVGLSRKSMIYKPINSTPDKVLEETIKINATAIKNGADILRVHDVKEHVEMIKMLQSSK